MRRRAALAIGRVGLTDGVPPLVAAAGRCRSRRARRWPRSRWADRRSRRPTPALAPRSDRRRRRSCAGAPPRRSASSAPQAAAAAIGADGRRVRAGAPPSPRCSPTMRRDRAAPEAEAFRLGSVRARAAEGVRPAGRGGARRGGQPRHDVVAGRLRAAAHRGPARRAGAAGSCSARPGEYTRAFAARGLGALKDAAARRRRSSPLLEPAATAGCELTVAAIRALAQIGDAERPPPLLAARRHADGATRTSGSRRSRRSARCGPPTGCRSVQDLLTDAWPAMRAAALRAAAAIDQESFMLVLSGLDPDRHWSVRAALADVARRRCPPSVAPTALRAMLQDEDKRVIPAVLARAGAAAGAAMPRACCSRGSRTATSSCARPRRAGSASSSRPAAPTALRRGVSRRRSATRRTRRARRRSTALAAYGAGRGGRAR